MHHPIDRTTRTTVFVIPVVEHRVEREIAEWVHHEGSIRNTTELHLAPLGYVEFKVVRSACEVCVCRGGVGWGDGFQFWSNKYRSSQCSSVTKAVVCTILFVGWCI